MNTVTFLQGPLAGLQNTSFTGNVTTDDINNISDQFDETIGYFPYKFPVYITTRWYDASGGSGVFSHQDWAIRINAHFDSETVDIVKDIDFSKPSHGGYATALRLPSSYSDETGYVFGNYDDYIILYRNAEMTGDNVIAPNEFIDINKCSAIILTGTTEGARRINKITATNKISDHLSEHQLSYIAAQQAVWCPVSFTKGSTSVNIKLLGHGSKAIMFGNWTSVTSDVTVTYYPNYGYSDAIPDGTVFTPHTSIGSLEERIAILESLIEDLEHQLDTASKFFITR